MKFRYIYMGIGSFLVATLLTLTDPDSGFITDLPFGGQFIATVVLLSRIILYAAATHFTRKGFIDYVDLEELFVLAKRGNQAAGSAIIGVAIMYLAIAVLIYAAVKV